jgi:AcrR family transcriptional regulator
MATATASGNASGSTTKRKRVAKSPEDRRADILRAGNEVFGSVGFPEATIEDITKVAGIAKGTFYLYFESKDHLLAALWSRYVEAFVDTTEAVLGEARPGDWLGTLDRLLTALIEHAVAHAELHLVVYNTANAKALELCKKSNQRVIELIVDFVRDAEGPGGTAEDREWACRMIYHAVDGLLDDLIARRGTIDVALVTRRVLAMAHATLLDLPA